MPKTLEQKIQGFRPQIERLLRKIENNDEGEQTFVTGFIFTRNKNREQGLVKFGNIDNKGVDFIRMHITLSSVASDMEQGIAFPGIKFTEISNGTGNDMSENLADALANAVLTYAGESSRTADLMDLAAQYLKTRADNEKTPT